MGFFEGRLPARDERDEDAEDGVDEPPPAYLGGVVPREVLVARSETAAVAVRGLVAFPDGFELRLALWTRGPRHRRGGHPWVPPTRPRPADLDEGAGLPDELLRFGIELPDGASVTNLDAWPWERPADVAEPSHGMQSSGGGGSDRHYEQSWWVWPLPGPGALAFVCEWPAYGIGETRYEIEADEIRRAAGLAQPVWPDVVGPSHRTHAQVFGRGLRRGHSGGTARPDVGGPQTP